MDAIHALRPGSTPWTTLETLDPATEPTVVAHGNVSREGPSLKRFVQRAINGAQLGKVVSADAVGERILVARDQRVPVDGVYGQGDHKCLLRALPIFGPRNRVHGVQFWFGPIAEDPPEPRPATGVVWDLLAKLVHLTTGCTRMAGVADAEFVPQLPLATFWRDAARFDHAEDVFELLYNPRERAVMNITSTVRHFDGHDMHWRAAVRARYDGETIGAWALLEDVTSHDIRPPQVTLEQQALHAYLKSVGAYLGVVHIPDGSVVKWLGDIPPWIDCTRPPEQLFPAEDYARLTAAVAPDEGVVHVLNADNGYTPTRIVLLPYRGHRNSNLALGQFQRVDSDSDQSHKRHVPPLSFGCRRLGGSDQHDLQLKDPGISGFGGRI